jgi:hypothetical protein
MQLLPPDDANPLSINLTVPQSYLFRFPPDSQPEVVPPPQTDIGLARPFNIDPKIYNDMLSVGWPVTIGLIYATTTWYLNGVNRRRANRPWPISKTKAFFAFVVIHNVFLAAYSVWTCWGMADAIRRSLPESDATYGVVEVVDALCKINGPRGIGSAVTFSPTDGAWSSADRSVRLLEGLPDNSDVGRIWNEGLSYYGWIFYVSKFYEVLDTFIILAKGKQSSLLQTYHHTGAMICMWAGIRYMSPPIWVFVLVNSGIHAMMVRNLPSRAGGVAYVCSTCTTRPRRYRSRCPYSSSVP